MGIENADKLEMFASPKIPRKTMIILVANVFTIIVQAVQIIIITSNIGTVGYGEYGLVKYLIELGIVTGVLGLEQGAARAIAAKEISRRTLSKSTLRISGIMSIILAGTILALSGYISDYIYNIPYLVDAIMIGAIAVSFGIMNTAMRSILNGLNNMERISLLKLVQAFSGLGLLILLVPSFGVFGAIASMTGSLGITTVASTLCTLPVIPKDPKNASINDASKLVLSDSLKFFGVSELSSLTVWLALAILNIIAGTGEVGLYLVAGFILSVMGEFSRALTYVLFPYFSHNSMERKQESIENILTSSVNFSFVMQLCIASLAILASSEICQIFGAHGCEPLIIIFALAAPITFGYRAIIVDALMTSIRDFRVLYKLQILYSIGCIPTVLLLSGSLGGLAMVIALVSAWILTTIYATWTTFGRIVAFSPRKFLERKGIRIGIPAYVLLIATAFWIPILPLLVRIGFSVVIGIIALAWFQKFLKDF